ncbi:MAG: DNA alkylation repair protein, partial [Candidatus Micrarchaeaceae archaeon]
MEEKRMDKLLDETDSWDICDTLCGELFSNTTYADKKIGEWVKSDKEFVKRAGFAMIAYKALRDPNASNSDFRLLFGAITAASADDRNYVKKAASWALREIGKRNITLNADAIKLAEEIGKSDSQAAQWVSKSVLSELKSDRVQKRLKEQTGHR